MERKAKRALGFDGGGFFVVLVLLALPAVLVGLSVDAHLRRARAERAQPVTDAVAVRLPSPDMALFGGARWLRAPTLEEPGAAFADGPGAVDPDPAGGLVAPPKAVWAEAKGAR
jgi:hypothetical protein